MMRSPATSNAAVPRRPPAVTSVVLSVFLFSSVFWARALAQELSLAKVRSAAPARLLDGDVELADTLQGELVLLRHPVRR